jgi:hypothetical protein
MGSHVLLVSLFLTLVASLLISTVSAQETTHPKYTGEKLKSLPPSGIENYFVYVMSATQWPINPNNSVYDATSYWQENANVNFKFVIEPGQASIMIRWIKESDGPYAAYIISNSLIEVGLGDSKCNGIWHQYDPRFTTSLLEHELGHALG